jgi:hypothetical protein
MQWLLAKAPGFQALPESDRAAIFNLTFLWSLFEAQVMESFARANLICDKATNSSSNFRTSSVPLKSRAWPEKMRP